MCRDRDFIIEAVSENLAIKRAVFSDMERLTAATTILASNTSAIRRSVKIPTSGARPRLVCSSTPVALITGRSEGSGLGLALAQDIVTRQGGLIEYVSAPGRTVFQMLFPIEEGDEEHDA